MSIYNKEFHDILRKRNVVTKKFQRDYEAEFEDLMKIVWWADSIKEAVYCCKNDIQDIVVCGLPDCDNKVKFHRKYTTFCCKSHSVIDEDRQKIQRSDVVRQKRYKTNIERYGGISPMCNESVRIKTKAVFEEKYGGQPSKNSKVKNKTRKTNIERYGYSSPLQNKEVDKKREKTLIERYGVKNHYEIVGMYDKARDTMFERYGNYNLVAECFQDQIRESFIERYECEYTLQSKELREKGLDTLREKYDVDYEITASTQIKEISDKSLSSAFKSKLYDAVDGQTIRIMGYEGFAYDYLYENGYRGIEWKVDNIDRIPYQMNNTQKYYQPDLYCDGVNYEVKSLYTLGNSYEKYLAVYDYTDKPLVFLVYMDRPNKDSVPFTINSKEELQDFIIKQII